MANAVCNLSRSREYLARQGYTDTMRKIVLTRADRGYRVYEPDEEAYQLPEISWALEGDRHTTSTLGNLVVRFLRTEEIVEYLKDLTVPANLRIDVYCYHLFHEGERYWLWGGVLRDLPGGISEYPVDKLELYFVGAPAAWPEADNVKDSVTGTWYENKHVSDVVLPALLGEAFKTISGRADLETPRVYNSSPFWSSIDRPCKTLAAPRMPYDPTCRVTGLSWDSNRELLYAGVHDAAGSSTLPWVISYDLASREWKRVTRLSYKGSTWQLRWPTEWEVEYLEYESAKDRLWGVAGTNFANLLDARAHQKAKICIYPGFEKFAHSTPIVITVGTALPANYTLNLNVSGIEFDTGDIKDRAIAYLNPSTGKWEEVDSWYGNADGINKLWFATPVGIPATTSILFRLFWGGEGRVTKTNRDNIFLFYHLCGDKINWTDFFAVFTVVAGEFRSAFGNFGRTLHSDDVGYNDVTVYGKCRAMFTNAGVCLRGNVGTDNAWVGYFDTAGNQVWIRRFQGAASVWNANVGFVTAAGTNYKVKFSAYGNNFQLWVSPDGTEITGAPLLVTASAIGNTERNVGCVAHGAIQSYFDDIYVTQRVQNEPVCNLGTTELINNIYDDNLFTLHNRGIKIRSKYMQYYNRRPNETVPVVDGVSYYGDMKLYGIGWPTARHEVKECGVLSNYPRIVAPSVSWQGYGASYATIGVSGDKREHPRIGMRAELWDTALGYRQELGEVIHIIDNSPSNFVIGFQNPILWIYGLPLSTPYLMLRYKNDLPGNNIFIGEPREVDIEYVYPGDSLPDPSPVYAEKRSSEILGDNFYWPRDVGSGDDGEKIKINNVGHYAFSTLREMELWYQDDPLTEKKYAAEIPLQFDINMEGYKASYALARGFHVASEIQSQKHEQPGPVTLYYNDEPVYTSEGKLLQSYSNIFISEDGDNVFVAWNERLKDDRDNWYNTCCQGKWNGTKVAVNFRDRQGNNWRASPERHITAYRHHKGKSYFGLRRHDKYWVNLGLRLFWAAPPQSAFLPSSYNGGYAVTCAVKGDKSDVLENGMIVRLGGIDTPGRQEWILTDVDTGTRRISFASDPWGGEYLADGEEYGIYKMTWFTLLQLYEVPGTKTYDQVIGEEVRGKYITLAAGIDERAEIAVL